MLVDYHASLSRGRKVETYNGTSSVCYPPQMNWNGCPTALDVFSSKFQPYLLRQSNQSRYVRSKQLTCCTVTDPQTWSSEQVSKQN
jgi:hypothetical protein